MTEEEKTEYYFACLLTYESKQFHIMASIFGFDLDETFFSGRKEIIKFEIERLNSDFTSTAVQAFHKVPLLLLFEKAEIEERAWVHYQAKKK